MSTALGAAALPLAGQQRRPNILFAIAGDWGWPHAGAYGCSWVHTPAFDLVANEGVLFTNFFTSNPKCSPCRASNLTCRNTWQLEEAVNHFGLFPSKWAVFPDLLEGAGYHVGYTGKGWGPGDHEAGGFTRNPAGPRYSRHNRKPPFRSMSNNDYSRNFEDFLEQRGAGQPFCFWFGTSEPHRAFQPGAGELSGKNHQDVDVLAFYPDNEAIRSDLADYAVESEWFAPTCAGSPTSSRRSESWTTRLRPSPPIPGCPSRDRSLDRIGRLGSRVDQGRCPWAVQFGATCRVGTSQFRRSRTCESFHPVRI